MKSRILATGVMIALVVALALPFLLQPKRGSEKSQRQQCQENLQAIDAAKAKWRQQKAKSGSDIRTWGDLIPEFLSRKPVCPLDPQQNGSTYTINRVDTFPTCSQGIGGLQHTYPAPPGDRATEDTPAK